MAETEGQLPLERQSNSNLTKIKKDIASSRDRIIAINKDIKELQAEKQHIRDGVEAMGIPKKAFDHAVRVAEMDPDKRRAYDFGYEVTREALNAQLDLFTSVDDENEAKPQNAPKATTAKKAAPAKKAEAKKPAAKKPASAPKTPKPAKAAKESKESKPAVDLSSAEPAGSA